MINKNAEVTSMDQSQLPTLNSILDTICAKAMSVKITNVLPTATTVSEGELVVYDNGAGVKRIYVITGKKNLGYINLT